MRKVFRSWFRIDEFRNTTTISGDLGLSPGLRALRRNLVIRSLDYLVQAVFLRLQNGCSECFNDMEAQSLAGGGAPLWSLATSRSGVWRALSDATFAGTLTLNGDYNDVWIFKISTNFTFSVRLS